MSRKSVPRVSYEGVLKECFRTNDESVARECPTKVFYKRVPFKSVKKCLSIIVLSVRFRARVCIQVRGFHLVCFLVSSDQRAIRSMDTLIRLT